ncbi:MAG TPA: hypothetical protein VF160_04040 [Candidatus Dormibacteraeota bacterium]
MIGLEIYGPAEWSNFFVLTGTGSAALAGLVFVAISVNLRGVLRDATHMYRAINMLNGFTAVFIVGSLALMGHQTNRTLGIEWLIVSLVAGAINTNGYIRGFSLTGSRYALGLFRIAGGTACYLGQAVGSALFFFGWSGGIYLSAAALVVNFYFLVSGSWLLIVGTFQGAQEARTGSSQGLR